MAELPDWIRNHLLPFVAFVLNIIVNLAYTKWPILDAIHLDRVVVLGFLNASMVAFALYLDKNLSKRAPWLQPGVAE